MANPCPHQRTTRKAEESLATTGVEGMIVRAGLPAPLCHRAPRRKAMTIPSGLSEQERADLVAYLDGELTGEAARALEAKITLDPQARAEAETLKRTWELLDFLPKPE